MVEFKQFFTWHAKFSPKNHWCFLACFLCRNISRHLELTADHRPRLYNVRQDLSIVCGPWGRWKELPPGSSVRDLEMGVENVTFSELKT